MIPRSWDRTSRRLAAVATSPVIGGLVWMIGMFGGALLAVAAYALLLPICYGCVVRLVDPDRSEHGA